MNALEVAAVIYLAVAFLVALAGWVMWDTEVGEPTRVDRLRRKYARIALAAPIWPLALLALIAIKGTAAVQGMWRDAFTK